MYCSDCRLISCVSWAKLRGYGPNHLWPQKGAEVAKNTINSEYVELLAIVSYCVFCGQSNPGSNAHETHGIHGKSGLPIKSLKNNL